MTNEDLCEAAERWSDAHDRLTWLAKRYIDADPDAMLSRTTVLDLMRWSNAELARISRKISASA